MRFESFKGLRAGGYFYKRSTDAKGGGARIRTFADPSTVAVFVARGAHAKSTIVADDTERGLVLILDKGAPTIEGLRYLAPLLTDDEHAILSLFSAPVTGIDIVKHLATGES